MHRRDKEATEKKQKMKLECDTAVLFIHPRFAASAEPKIDDLTRDLETIYGYETKMTKTAIQGHVASNAARFCSMLKCKQPCTTHKEGVPGFVAGVTTNGWHTCTAPGCEKVTSLPHDYLLSNGIAVNSLALHYLMYHRSEIPKHDLDMIAS